MWDRWDKSLIIGGLGGFTAGTQSGHGGASGT